MSFLFFWNPAHLIPVLLLPKLTDDLDYFHLLCEFRYNKILFNKGFPITGLLFWKQLICQLCTAIGELR